MQPSFDFTKSIEARDAGMAQAADNKRSLLEHARGIARRIARENGEVSADDVQKTLEQEGISIRALGNAAGSLFKGGEWEFVRYTRSSRIHAHSNLLRVWRLR